MGRLFSTHQTPHHARGHRCGSAVQPPSLLFKPGGGIAMIMHSIVVMISGLWDLILRKDHPAMQRRL